MASGHLKAPRKQAEQIAAPISPAFTVKNPLPTGSRPQMPTGSRPQMANFPPHGQVRATGSLPPDTDLPMANV
jgi:hypothetical protein